MAKQKAEPQPPPVKSTAEFPFERSEFERMHREQCLRFHDKIIDVIHADKETALHDMAVSLAYMVGMFVNNKVISKEHAVESLLTFIEDHEKRRPADKINAADA